MDRILPQALGALAISAAGLSALMGLFSFWPREFQVLDVARIRDDALGVIPDISLRTALLDTNLSTINGNRNLLHTKATRLTTSVAGLFVAVILLGASVLVDRL